MKLAQRKRIFDISLSLLLIVLTSPVILIICFLILLLDGRPVFFLQARPGKSSSIFTMYKFRTMHNDISKTESERISKLGNFLRSSSLDELPELFNILLGHMSFVGPRPLLIEYLPLYSETQKRRHDVKPGLTGWAQINGRNTIDWEEKFDLDVWYVENQSFYLDLKIILLTALKVLKREGITAQNEATMKKFEGSQNKNNI